MTGDAPVYQVNPLRRMTGEGRVEFLRTWGPGFDQKERGEGGGRGGASGAAHSVRGNRDPYPVSPTTSEEMSERSRWWG